MSGLHDSDSSASHALLVAALGGLLALTLPACSGDDTDVATAASTTCETGVVADPKITSSTQVANLTLEAFTADCDERNGAVQIHPHCGGANGCRGISYDSDTDILTEHTCRALNTCTGFSCIVCD